jgi:hypothetical protein
MSRHVALLVLAALIGAAATPAAVPQHRIGVRVVGGDGEFFDRRSGATFVPRGSTYLRRGWRDVGGGRLISYQATFDIGVYDAAAAEAALEAMRAERYNAVTVSTTRACVRTCLGDATTTQLSFDYLTNVLDFLRRAKANGLQVVLAIDEPPWGTTWNAQIGAPFDGFNAWYLTRAGVDGFSAFWRTFVGTLGALRGPLDTVWVYELGGETWFQADRGFGTCPAPARRERRPPLAQADRRRRARRVPLRVPDRRCGRRRPVDVAGRVVRVRRRRMAPLDLGHTHTDRAADVVGSGRERPSRPGTRPAGAAGPVPTPGYPVVRGPVAQWIERQTSNLRAVVRLHPGPLGEAAANGHQRTPDADL